MENKLEINIDLETEFVKLRFAGDQAVGKTCLLNRFIDGMYAENTQVTPGQDVKFKTVTLDGETFKVQLIDTAGQERFRTVTSSYYRGAHGFLLCYDITNRESFEDVREWLVEVDRFVGKSNPVKIIVGNKCDLEGQRAVSKEEAKEWADSHNFKFLEVSAKDDTNVDEAYNTLLQDILERIPNREKKPAGGGKGKKGKVDLKKDNSGGKKKGGCSLF